MATWEPGKFTPKHLYQERRAFALVIASLSVLTVMLVGAGAYWILRLEGELAEAPSPTEVTAPPRVSQGRIPETAERRDIPQVRDARARTATLQSPAEPSTFATIYILEFGRFSNLSAALARAQQVRGKGYAAKVAGGKALYRVVGREFRSQAGAERWKGILEEIGLESRVSQQVVAQRTITVEKFAVDFGGFTQRTAAETLARIVRSRGYLVKVAHTGPGFQVLGRGHMDKTRAESWANLFREIGFEASVTSIRELTQYPVN